MRTLQKSLCKFLVYYETEYINHEQYKNMSKIGDSTI